ncbi:cyclase family protein, partial [Alphaproteobacteria bacterium]|nr:cyclase family protein [Alphaproteobacteria bacterium]
HVDAPCHFDERETAQSVDQMPLENFYRPALCLDLSHKPLKSDISISDLQEAEAKTGETINSGDIVLLYMAHYDRTFGSPEFLTDFPGLTEESAQWLGRKKITSFGVEAVSPGRPGKNNFEVHLVCRDMGFTHMEGLANLHQVIGLGHFQFAGFPLKIRGGTGSPIRAVAIIDET